MLSTQRIGRKVDQVRSLLKHHGLEQVAAPYLANVSAAISRRDVLAHSPLFRRPTKVVPIRELASMPVEMETLIRRRGKSGPTFEVIAEDSLADDLTASQAAFSGLLNVAEIMVERVPWPTNFEGGLYLGRPTP